MGCSGEAIGLQYFEDPNVLFEGSEEVLTFSGEVPYSFRVILLCLGNHCALVANQMASLECLGVINYVSGNSVEGLEWL